MNMLANFPITDGSGNTATQSYSVTAGGVQKTLEYDANGNLRYERDTNGSVLREFQWDAKNRLVKIIDDSHETHFRYDGLDRRVGIVEKENGVEQSNQVFIWDGTQIVQKRDSTGATVERNYFDLGFEEGDSNYYYTKDHLGSIREVVASDGTTVESIYDYSPWGEVTKTGGTGVESDFLYTGHLYHFPSDLHLALYRAYDPELGMWLSRDPIAENGGLNLYAYVGNNPVMLYDLFGLRWYHDVAIGGLNLLDGGLSFAAGIGDAATFGLTSKISNGLNNALYGDGTGDAVDQKLKCSKSHTAGQIAGSLVPGASGVAGAAKLAGPGSKLLGKGSQLFGRGGRHGSKGVLNTGPVRTGWGWNSNTQTNVFRTSWSRAGNRSGANHLDFDNFGLGVLGGLAAGSLIENADSELDGCD